MSDNICESATFQIFHDDPEFVIHEITVVHLHDVVMMILAHDHDLVEEELATLLLTQVHLLDSHLSTCLPVDGRAHDACRALTNLEKPVIHRTRVRRIHDHL